MAETSIEWCDHTTNPIRFGRGHYCQKVSPGCANCYASALQHRFGNPEFGGTGSKIPVIAGALAERDSGAATLVSAKSGDGSLQTGPARQLWLDESKLQEVLRRKRPTRYFWCDMTDLFGSWVPDEWIDRCFATMALTPQHTHQVLTKRAERMREYLSDPQRSFKVAQAADALQVAMEAAAIPLASKAIYDGKYIVTNAGDILTSHGSVTCVWCGTAFENGQQDSRFCGQSCRSKSHYAKSCGRCPEPAGAVARRVNPDIGEDGHSRVLIIGDGRELVHRLVLTTFDRPPMDGEQACHRDGNPLNNHIANLRWGTQSDNWDDRKRHGNARSYQKLSDEQAEAIRRKIGSGHPAERVAREFGISGTQARNIARGDQWAVTGSMPWPLPGVWCGVSVEDQQRADERIPLLLQTPAAVRFVSAEPLLSVVDLSPWLDQWRCIHCSQRIGEPGGAFEGGEWQGDMHVHSTFGPHTYPAVNATLLDWLIVGGESGKHARPTDVAWIRSLVQQSGLAGVACFVKQDSGPRPGKQGRIPDDIWKIKEWPADLRVREYPESPGYSC